VDYTSFDLPLKAQYSSLLMIDFKDLYGMSVVESTYLSQNHIELTDSIF